MRNLDDHPSQDGSKTVIYPRMTRSSSSWPQPCRRSTIDAWVMADYLLRSQSNRKMTGIDRWLSSTIAAGSGFLNLQGTPRGYRD